MRGKDANRDPWLPPPPPGAKRGSIDRTSLGDPHPQNVVLCLRRRISQRPINGPGALSPS